VLVVVAVLVAAPALLGACGTDGREVDGATSADVGAPSSTDPGPATTDPPRSTPPTTAAAPTSSAFDVRAVLERLVVDDRPRPDRPYRREEWRHWDDLDGDGCDARDEGLISASVQPAVVAPGCSVVAGDWVSPYDGVVSTDPGAVQIDHLVPLQDAFVSGGWRWDTPRRRLFANDPAGLVAVSAASNQAKGAQAPDEWRPPDHRAWCPYALAWAHMKVTYDLTVTTEERDALGQMLEGCPPGTARDARPGPLPGTPAPTVPVAPTTAPPGEEPSYANCAAARAAGVAPILRGQPGYRDRLDGDGDGVACE